MSGGELVGDPSLQITGAAPLAEAVPGEISFFGNPKYLGLLRKTCASAVFISQDFADSITAAQIRVSNPTKAFEAGRAQVRPQTYPIFVGIRTAASLIRARSSANARFDSTECGDRGWCKNRG
jgi:UDP-3-O-[3-hydroxymyristoyl] glucosamine N-acyltransferase